MPEVIYFYVIGERDSKTREWKLFGSSHYESIEEAQRAISIVISCKFDDFFRYEISGDEHSRNVWDRETKDWVGEYRIELYCARKVKP